MHVTRLAALVAAATVALSGGQAAAVSSACINFSPNVTGFVSPSIACEIDPAVDNDSPIGQFLAANWFGFSDWVFDAKTNSDQGANGIETIDQGPNTLNLSITGDTSGGTWSIGGSAPGPVMMVLKGGDKKVPDALVAYLLAGVSGSYSSPFFTSVDDFPDSPSAISHISLYYRVGNNVEIPDVPLPAAAPMLIGGLAVLGFMGWRRRAS